MNGQGKSPANRLDYEMGLGTEVWGWGFGPQALIMLFRALGARAAKCAPLAESSKPRDARYKPAPQVGAREDVISAGGCDQCGRIAPCFRYLASIHRLLHNNALLQSTSSLVIIIIQSIYV